MTDDVAEIVEARKKKIGDRIAKCRKAEGLSQRALGEEIAKRIGRDDPEVETYGQSTISEWESGKRLPSMKVLLALSSIFSCDCGFLLCDYDDKTYGEKFICEQTGLSEKTVNSICYLKKWGSEKELVNVVNSLVYDFYHSSKENSAPPLIYLLNWFLTYSGKNDSEKMLLSSGDFIDVQKISDGYFPNYIRVDGRFIENAVLVQIQQSLLSLKKMLQKKEARKHGKY